MISVILFAAECRSSTVSPSKHNANSLIRKLAHMRIAHHIAAVAVASTLALGGLQVAALADALPSNDNAGQGNSATLSGNNAGQGNGVATPSGNNAGQGNGTATPSGNNAGFDLGPDKEQYLDGQYEPLAVKVSATKVAPGQSVTFEFIWTEKDRRPAYDAVNVEVHSKVYKLGEHKLDKDGKAVVKWTVPADMELGTHKVLVPEAEGRVIATFEVVKATDVKKAASSKLAITGATGVFGALAGLSLAGVAAVAMRRRMS